MEKIKFVFQSGHVMFCWFNSIKYQIETIYSRYEHYHKQIQTKHSTRLHGVSMVTCYFHMWRYHFFVQMITWYFIGVYIINVNLLFQSHNFTLSNVKKHSDFLISSSSGPKVYSLKYFSKPDQLLKYAPPPPPIQSANWNLMPPHWMKINGPPPNPYSPHNPSIMNGP